MEGWHGPNLNKNRYVSEWTKGEPQGMQMVKCWGTKTDQSELLYQKMAQEQANSQANELKHELQSKVMIQG